MARLNGLLWEGDRNIEGTVDCQEHHHGTKATIETMPLGLSLCDGTSVSKARDVARMLPFVGARMALLVAALREFDSRWCHWNSSLT